MQIIITLENSQNHLLQATRAMNVKKTWDKDFCANTFKSLFEQCKYSEKHSQKTLEDFKTWLNTDKKLHEVYTFETEILNVVVTFRLTHDC